MANRIELAGLRFGAWSVIEYAGRNSLGQPSWHCVCDCGVSRAVVGQALRTGGSRSCGCEKPAAIAAKKTLHGRARRDFSPEYRAWLSMRMRCSPNNRQVRARYFERGIGICQRWDSFKNFLADMGPIPRLGLTLDRIDNDRGYEPSNCRWADAAVQAQNRAPSHLWRRA